MKKINVANWLSNEDMDKIEMLANIVGITEVQEQLLNFDMAVVYDDTTKYALGSEVAEDIGAINEENYYSKYFDYEKFADDLLDDEDSGYFLVEDDSKYLHIDCPSDADGSIVLGKMKTGSADGQFVKLDKHDFVCDWYWSYGHISNNGMSCGLEEYYDKTVDEAFEYTWITAEAWDKFRDGMNDCREVFGNKTDTDELGVKLDILWNYLMEEHNKIELVLEK